MRFVPPLACAAVVCLAFATGCPPKYPKCDSDKDCHEKEYCVNGQCQQCRADGDCPAAASATPAAAKRRRRRTSAAPTTRSARPGSRASTASCKPCTSDDQCGEGGKCNAGTLQRAAAATPPPVNAKCTLEPVYFDFNESVLTTEATVGHRSQRRLHQEDQPRRRRSRGAPIRAAPRSTTWRSATSARSRSRIAHEPARRRRRT